MKIYTKTGDAGDTGLFGGERVKKSDARVDAYGSVDETNALLGVARAVGLSAVLDAILERLQTELFVLGAELATPPAHRQRLRLPLIDESHVAALEADIDRLDAELAPLTSFIVPGGSAAASALHHARTVCRRAERGVVSIAASAQLRDEIVVYLNRTSDLLFVMARHANHTAGVADVAWAPRQRG